jgi:GSH-dependent disulfide-bond oxidoreductase
MIELFFWTTANPKKISIMLEECDLPYRVVPVDIAKGEQFRPEFLSISPNNRVPVIIDSDGPDGAPISVFESGAILRYLGVKTGRFYPADHRGQVEVDQWLFWQIGGLGPMSGQAHHFAFFASAKLPYAITRYSNEVHRLYGVMDARLRERAFLAGDYSIADIACYPWIVHHSAPGHPGLGDFPHLQAWFERVGARPAVQRGMAVGAELRSAVDDAEARDVLFNQRARTIASSR